MRVRPARGLSCPQIAAGPEQSGSDEAALARARGEPLLEALSERLPAAAARGDIAATLAAAVAAERTEGAEAALIAEAARLQEVGKLYVPRELLARAAGELSGSERAALDSHYEHGRALARGAGVPERACTWILHARERWDGAGPGGLSGAEIPLGSRIVAVTREYLDAPQQAGAETGEPLAAALQRLGALAGGILDPELAAGAARLAAEGSR